MSADTAGMTADPAVRSFHVEMAEEAVADLRRRIAAWRPPEREPVDDQSQGVQLATVRDLANYWATEYDWRRCEATLNALPQFMTEIDSIDVHFIHVRSPHEGALPLIVSHGWPGSVIEQLRIIEPLTNPAEHGGSASDAFDVVIPSLPGYGFSGKPATTGWDPDRIAHAWAVLMQRLGYARYVAQGGDWGTAISAAMWLLDHDETTYTHFAQLFAGHPFGAITRDDWLDNSSLYWLTNTATSAARLYWQQAVTGKNFYAAANVSLPAAVTVFPEEYVTAPRSWEQPQLLSEELRAAFRILR